MTINASKRNLLALVQAACDELGIPRQTQLVGNVDPGATQLLALANREGKEFSTASHRIGGWQEMRIEYTFNTAGVGSITGNTTNGSAIITGMSTTTGIVAGYIGSINGFVSGVSVVSVDSSTQVTMSANATATATGVSMSFGSQSYSFPSDFGYFIQQTMWDRAFRWQLLGPLEAQEWQVLKSGISPTGPRRRFRIMGNQFYIDPVPSSVTTEVFEYYSNSWCQSAGQALQTIWTADTDYYVLDDDAFILGLKWRYLAAKKLDYQEEYNSWTMRTERLMARNGGNRTLPLNATAAGVNFLNNNNVPDTGYGS